MHTMDGLTGAAEGVGFVQEGPLPHVVCLLASYARQFMSLCFCVGMW